MKEVESISTAEEEAPESTEQMLKRLLALRIPILSPENTGKAQSQRVFRRQNVQVRKRVCRCRP